MNDLHARLLAEVPRLTAENNGLRLRLASGRATLLSMVPEELLSPEAKAEFAGATDRVSARCEELCKDVRANISACAALGELNSTTLRRFGYLLRLFDAVQTQGEATGSAIELLRLCAMGVPDITEGAFASPPLTIDEGFCLAQATQLHQTDTFEALDFGIGTALLWQLTESSKSIRRAAEDLREKAQALAAAVTARQDKYIKTQ